MNPLDPKSALLAKQCTTCHFDPLSHRAFSGGSRFRLGGPLDKTSPEQGHTRSRGTSQDPNRGCFCFADPRHRHPCLAMAICRKKAQGTVTSSLRLRCFSSVALGDYPLNPVARRNMIRTNKMNVHRPVAGMSSIRLTFSDRTLTLCQINVGTLPCRWLL